MSHLIIVPVVLPALMAAFLVLAARHDMVLQRALSASSAVLLLACALFLYGLAAEGQPLPYLLGDWPAPFGIVLVLDRLSALMLVLTGILGVAVALFAMTGRDTGGRHFHALLQFQLMGINGAFLTGDLFNLFVFFEVLLIASYGLMLHGGGPRRLGAGLHYVIVNLVGSTLFLFAVGMIYAVTGTLNMADLAIAVGQVAPGDAALLRAGGGLLLTVFAIKAALVPFHWWLRGTYSAAPAPVAALFAIMTKVGAYSIIRVFTLIFGAGAGDAAWLAAPWILPAALVTLVLGTIGLLASRTLFDLAAFSIVASMGTLLIAIGLFTPEAMTAALYYLIHSTFTGAALFMVGGIVATGRGETGDRLVAAAPFPRDQLVAGLFFLAAIAMAGMPPLSGFLGKLLILESAQNAPLMSWIWAIVLGTSLLMLVGFGRAGSVLFWKSAAVAGDGSRPVAGTGNALPLVATATVIAGTALLTLLAGPATAELDLTTRQIFDPTDYVRAVLGDEAALQIAER
ncbi:monovalent cation/H+ antiporter subunit D [Marinimicrococcus flavescens]|uniref:Monovalent cation/H+ antiporter subunit D n=1 Tax=Marinimicrococcus flavescens TaxID=3031815 RepID=A0AAP3V1U2_9PROT|nr:monovalent cation/H+ antiporter subunit D [Marinimicrococcus flavescens]